MPQNPSGQIIVLAIESSCDETAASLVRYVDDTLTPLSQIVSSQVKLHATWGGVVPNLAAREHVKNMLPVVETCFAQAHLTSKDIDAIAVTNRPGLIPALLVGTSTAKTLAYLWKKPLLGIHHIEGHIYANFLSSQDIMSHHIEFPCLSLVVSGGHTQLIYMEDHFRYEIIGETQDDAVGEAFDKVARILGIGYPGGPIVSQKASQCDTKNTKYNIVLPRPMYDTPTYHMSFSGLKTAVLYAAKKNEKALEDEKFIQEMCHEFQQAAVDVLIRKTLRALKHFPVKSFLLAGGVAANTELRIQLETAIREFLPQIGYHIPELQYTGDNATMIAAAGCFRFAQMNEVEKEFACERWRNLDTVASISLDDPKNATL